MNELQVRVLPVITSSTSLCRTSTRTPSSLISVTISIHGVIAGDGINAVDGVHFTMTATNRTAVTTGSWISLFLLAAAASSSNCHGFIQGPPVCMRPPSKSSCRSDIVDNERPISNGSSNVSGGKRMYFDIQVEDDKHLGRLVFELADPSPLPLHTENFVQLCLGSRRGIDPLAHYTGCEFDYSPATIEDGSGRYRWGHTLKGRGRNAIGRADQPIVEHPNQLLTCTHSCFGGQYYGIKYEDDNDNDDRQQQSNVVLAVPIVGPGRGSSRFSILRVGESPPEWRERLLLNCGVVGVLSYDSMGTLRAMARQRAGPPKIIASGMLD